MKRFGLILIGVALLSFPAHAQTLLPCSSGDDACNVINSWQQQDAMDRQNEEIQVQQQQLYDLQREQDSRENGPADEELCVARGECQ